jgi:MoxR-like ATPase
VKDQLAALYQRLTTTVLGAEMPAQMLITALLAHGHVLIQGAPGIGKTSLAQTLADSISGTFSRIQFTPDLLPSDILGYSIYNQARAQFEFIQGPVFRNIVLADEINRTSPRIQSALLECMNEQQVTVDGVTRPLASPFLVIATQNNMYASGTFPLPEPQLDRFLLSINMSLPDLETQAKILQLHADRASTVSDQTPILGANDIAQMQDQVKQVQANDRICRYIALICESLRKQEGSRGSLSARASIALLRAAQASAYLAGVNAVYPDHVKLVAGPVLSHRLSVKESRGQNGADADQMIATVLKNVPVP